MTWDAIVVGSGFGGAMAAHALRIGSCVARSVTPTAGCAHRALPVRDTLPTLQSMEVA